MSPLQMANWREINRRFCALCWIVAVALAVVIIGHAATATSSCSNTQLAKSGGACVSSAIAPRAVASSAAAPSAVAPRAVASSAAAPSAVASSAAARRPHPSPRH